MLICNDFYYIKRFLERENYIILLKFKVKRYLFLELVVLFLFYVNIENIFSFVNIWVYIKMFFLCFFLKFIIIRFNKNINNY